MKEIRIITNGLTMFFVSDCFSCFLGTITSDNIKEKTLKFKCDVHNSINKFMSEKYEEYVKAILTIDFDEKKINVSAQLPEEIRNYPSKYNL